MFMLFSILYTHIPLSLEQEGIYKYKKQLNKL